MRHYLGLFERSLRDGKEAPVIYEPSRLINGHMLLCGMSGTGKSFQSKRFLASAASVGLDIDIFDVHDELSDVPGSVAVTYSQATGYGYNPLEIDNDIHVGGPLRQANFFISLIRSVTSGFGSVQEAVLRNLLADVYAANGIFADNAKTWTRKSITASTRKEIVAARRWKELRDYYPTLDDLHSYAWKKVQALTIGGDSLAAAAFENLSRTMKQIQRVNKNYNNAAEPGEREALELKMDELKTKALDAYANFIQRMETGKEVEDMLKYNSVETLNGILRRIDLLNSAGIFNANPPPFGGARVKVHQMKALTREQQILFARLRLREIFEQRKSEGAMTRPGLKHVIFLDEAHKYFVEDSDDIINVIAKEARKFGIALWCASQQPTEFPESFLTNCGATVLLGIHASFWLGSIKKLRISEDQLKSIRAKDVLAIKLQKDGEADPPFLSVAVPNTSSETGRLAAAWPAKARAAAKAA